MSENLSSSAKPNVSGIERRGLMFVLSSPSGAGKTTLCQNLMKEKPELALSVSVTTRARRGSEIDGIHYNFVSEDEFIAARDKGEFLEWAKVHGHYYATPRKAVQKAMDEGRDMLFDIDWQGASQMFDAARADIVSVFILPPSMAELRERLRQRAQDSQEVIAERLANARTEMSHWSDYDYVIVNDDLERAFEELRAILRAEQLRRDRLVGLHEFVDDMLAPE